MKTQLLIITVISGLLLAGPTFAQKTTTPDNSTPETGKELTKKERRHLRKSMKHNKMAQKYQQKAMRHQGKARQNMKQLHMQKFGPENGQDRPWGQRQHMRNNMRFQNQPFGQGMNPDCPVGPRQERRFQNNKFGPGMNPDCPTGPPQHMRFRDGKRQSRSQ